MKKSFLVVLLAIGLSISIAHNAYALLFTFEGMDAGGIASAKMDVTLTGGSGYYYANFYIYNTSPTSLVNGTAPNTPGITDLGFTVDFPTRSHYYSLWANTADNREVEIGAYDGPGGFESWHRVYSQQDIQSDWWGINAALFNPDSMNVPNNLPPGYYPFPGPPGVDLELLFTTARLIISIDTGIPEQWPATTLTPENIHPYLIMENVGYNGSGTVVMEGHAAVPEPATVLLLASGLVGLAGLRKKFSTM